MSTNTSHEITRILQEVEHGNGRASEELLPLVYEELRRLAAGRMAQEAAGQTLQATALVHEAWLRLFEGKNQNWQGRGHFFGAAAEAMRRILIERARRKLRLKRGGGQIALNIEDIDIAEAQPDEQILLIDEALDRLRTHDPEWAHIVTLKFYAGLTDKEVAETLKVTDRTVRNKWRYARAWLLEEIRAQNHA
jgi:RNA polymerase sigma factor (TIGR02999 family)